MRSLILSLLLCSVGFLRAADIVALVIGNNAYVTPEDVLDTPVNDARLMHQTLRAVPGVQAADIVLLEDAKRSQITLALRQFKARAEGAKLALIFYSGHGVEDTPTGYDRAETFLLPVDAVIDSADDLPDKAVPLKTVLEALEGTRDAARGVILDCCRSGAPGATKSLARAGKNLSALDESVKKALGGAILPEGTLIAFAASPGRKAAAFLTESDTNSPFTRFISEQMSTQGGNLFSIVNAASRITKQRTEMRQVPHVELRGDASLITDFTIPASSLVKLTTPQTTPVMTEAAIERMARELAAKMTALPASPMSPPATSSSGHEVGASDRTIVYGRRVGAIHAGMNRKQIAAIYGERNLADLKIEGTDPDSPEQDVTVLFKGTDEELRFYWTKGSKNLGISNVEVTGSKWAFDNGLKIGMAMEDVEKINGAPFFLHLPLGSRDLGAEDLGGYAEFKSGNLKGVHTIRFRPDAINIPDSLQTEGEASSERRDLRALNLKVVAPFYCWSADLELDVEPASSPEEIGAATVEPAQTSGLGYLGVDGDDLDQNTARRFGLKSGSGILISSVLRKSPAEVAGLSKGDLIIFINGRAANVTQMVKLVRGGHPGTVLQFEILRGGKRYKVTITLGTKSL
jgi:hypothetical protein